MELTDRELLIKVDQQMKDSIRNQSQVLDDLKEIFKRIEVDSKIVTQVKMKTEEFERRLAEQQEFLDDLEEKMQKEKDRRIEEIDRLGEKINQEKNDRTEDVNEQEVKIEQVRTEANTRIKTVAWIFGILSALGTATAAIFAFLQFLGK